MSTFASRFLVSVSFTLDIPSQPSGRYHLLLHQTKLGHVVLSMEMPYAQHERYATCLVGPAIARTMQCRGSHCSFALSGSGPASHSWQIIGVTKSCSDASGIGGSAIQLPSASKTVLMTGLLFWRVIHGRRGPMWLMHWLTAGGNT